MFSTFSIIPFAVILSAALLNFLNVNKLQVEAFQCLSNAHCKSNYYCCKRNRVCGNLGCVGHPCSLDSDCGGPGECCGSTNYCTKSGCNECSSNSDCGYNKYCCKQRYSYQLHICSYSGCVGQSCISDSDCGGPGEYCSSYYCTKSSVSTVATTARSYVCSSNSDCGNNLYCCKKLRYCFGDCLGKSCSTNSDCSGPNECCSSKDRCKRSSCAQFPSWLISVIVVSAVVFIAIVVGCCYGMIRASHRRRPQVGVVVGQQQPCPKVNALQNTQSGHLLPPHPSAYLNQAQDLSQAQAQVPTTAYKH